MEHYMVEWEQESTFFTSIRNKPIRQSTCSQKPR